MMREREEKTEQKNKIAWAERICYVARKRTPVEEPGLQSGQGVEEGEMIGTARVILCRVEKRAA